MRWGLSPRTLAGENSKGLNQNNQWQRRQLSTRILRTPVRTTEVSSCRSV
jgi:hypothetical protein